MKSLILISIGFFLGFYIATNGISGVANAIDDTVRFVKHSELKVEIK
jgi:hypothetical protein